jgi:uncharacterized membrane protein YoaK (UPF0700 family)
MWAGQLERAGQAVRSGRDNSPQRFANDAIRDGWAKMGVLRDAFETLRPPAGDRHGPLTPMLVALTMLTGIVDAASYLKLGHVFVANMTGNVVFVGFALAGAGGLSATASLIALASFLVGARLGGWLIARNPGHRGHMLRATSSAQALLILLAFLLALSAAEPLQKGARYGLTALLALAMGAQNASAQSLAVPELTTTVLTRTLTGIGLAGSAPDSKLGRRVVAVAAMFLGALGGGLLALEVSVAAGLAAAASIALAVALGVHLASRPGAAWARV